LKTRHPRVRHSLTLPSGGAAPSFGPVIAGVLTEKLGWRWIFWFLVIFTATYLVVVALLLPETQRKLVGNGSIATRGLHRSLFDVLTKNRRAGSSQLVVSNERASRCCSATLLEGVTYRPVAYSILDALF
jgi:MFS family permease